MSSSGFVPGTEYGAARSAAPAWVLSRNRRDVSWRTVALELGRQLVFGALVLTPALQDVFFTVVDGGVRCLAPRIRIDVVPDDGVTTMTVAWSLVPGTEDSEDSRMMAPSP